MSVYFHSSFNLNREILSRILKIFLEKPELNDDQIAKNFGYKAPFTKRYKSWLKKCGLIENTSKVMLTEFGRVIYEKDPKLEKIPTLCYMHTYLSSREDNAEAWHYFYHTYLPKTNTFNKLELSNALSMKLMAHHPSHFGKNAPMIKVITKVLIDSYISESAFGQLGIVKTNGEDYFRVKTKNLYKWESLKTFAELY